MEYSIVQETSAYRLAEEVNLAIAKGWEPIGGVTVHQEKERLLFYQAIIKQ